MSTEQKEEDTTPGWALASSLTAASEIFHDEKHGPMCTCELSRLLREFAGGMMTERVNGADALRKDLKTALLEMHAIFCALPPEEWSKQRQIFAEIWNRRFPRST
jgi:hypothetical protein